jgi:hypothetical protein
MCLLDIEVPEALGAIDRRMAAESRRPDPAGTRITDV